MPTIAYTALGTHVFINGAKLAQVASAMWDHTLGRLRFRVIHWPGDPSQEFLRSLRSGAFVQLRLELPDKTARESTARIRFCRTRMSLNAVNRTTVEFAIDEEAFSRILLTEHKTA